jgi:hypothetical protein
MEDQDEDDNIKMYPRNEVSLDRVTARLCGEDAGTSCLEADIYFISLDRGCLSPGRVLCAPCAKISEDACPELPLFINPFHYTNGISRSEWKTNTLAILGV